MCWHVSSCDLLTMSECVTTAKDIMDDLLLRMMRCELDDFEIVSNQLDHVRSHDAKLLCTIVLLLVLVTLMFI